MQQQLNGLRYSTSKMKSTFYKTPVFTTANSIWNNFCCVVTICLFTNKQNFQCSHVMDTGWARDKHKSYAGSHARRLHLTSAFGWGHITEESRGAGKVVDSGSLQALPHCEVFQRSQHWLPHCNGHGRGHEVADLPQNIHSQEAWEGVKDAHHNVIPWG